MAKGAHSKADAVYGELKEAILSGTLEPGCLIDKAGLCEKLGVSRFPVSAAVSAVDAQTWQIPSPADTLTPD